MGESNSEILENAHSEFKKRRYKEAEELYTKFISSCLQSRGCEAGDLATAYNNRGQIKYLRVDFHEAVEDYTCAIQTDSLFEIPFYNRGLIHYRLALQGCSLCGVVRNYQKGSRGGQVMGAQVSPMHVQRPKGSAANMLAPNTTARPQRSSEGHTSTRFFDDAKSDFQQALNLNPDFEDAKLSLQQTLLDQQQKINRGY